MKNVIIGAGPAGRLAGLEFGRLGEEALLIEKNDLGGTCLNEGCMVVCALNDIAKFLNAKKQYERLGLLKGNIDISYEEIVNKIKKTQEIIHEINHKENTAHNNEIIYGEAKLGENELTVNGETWQWENLLIATGGRPFIPNIPGKEYGLTNQDLLKIKEVPEKLNIIGGGIIAAEISNIFSSLGSKVNIIARSGFLKELDVEIREYVIEKLFKNVKVYENMDLLEIKKKKIIAEDKNKQEFENKNKKKFENKNKKEFKDKNKKELKNKTEEFKDSEIKEFEGKTFIATGRVPNSEIARTILKDDDFDKKGAIKVNEMMQTSKKNVYAAGDVTGGITLTPVARMEGILASRNMAGYSNKIEYKAIPQTIALDMNVSFAKNNDLKNNDFENNSQKTEDIILPGSAGPGGWWRVLTGDTGITKSSFNTENDLLESITAVSPSSVSDIAYLSYLMRIGENIENFDEFIEIHPSTDVFFQIMKYI